MRRFTMAPENYIMCIDSTGRGQEWRSPADVLDMLGDVADADTVDGEHAAEFEHVANKGAASGYASLNVSSLVEQDPVNATATPTASKIVKAEAGGTIALGWFPAALTGKDADSVDGAHLDIDGTLAAYSDAKVPSQKATKDYVDDAISTISAMEYIGTIDCSADPNYPAADLGHVYIVSVAGHIGGGAGPDVVAGDMLLCKVNGSAAGTHAAVGANWNIVASAVAGSVTGPAGATDDHLASFDGVTGAIIKDSGFSVSDFALQTEVQWTLDGSNYIVPSASHPVAPITHQVEELGVYGTREWGAVNVKDAKASNSIRVGLTTAVAALTSIDVAGNIRSTHYGVDVTPNIIYGRKSRGSEGVLGAILSGDFLFQFRGDGDTGADMVEGGSILWQAAENFSPAAQGTRILIRSKVIGGTTAANKIYIGGSGSIGFGANMSAFGTDAAFLLGHKGNLSVAPTSFPADCVQFGAMDIAAGHRAMHFWNENGTLIKLYQQAVLAAPKNNYVAGELDTEAEVINAVNAIATAVGSLITYEKNAGFIAAA